jgi:hypothetical protein
MLYREIISVCSEIHTKHINTLCGQNVELLNVKPGGARSNEDVSSSWDGKSSLLYNAYLLQRQPSVLKLI